jgi:hypothetical protein
MKHVGITVKGDYYVFGRFFYDEETNEIIKDDLGFELCVLKTTLDFFMVHLEGALEIGFGAFPYLRATLKNGMRIGFYGDQVYIESATNGDLGDWSANLYELKFAN